MQIGNTQLILVQGDITKQETDVIVNAANSGLLGGGGVDGAIHRAGGPAILEECKKIRSTHGQCAPGDAVITGGGNLKAKWVVHAVGPIWRGGRSNEAETLASAYKRSLELADQAGAQSIAFPSISTGAYGYPVTEAAPIAINEVSRYINDNPEQHLRQICFVLFDLATFKAYENAAANLKN